MILGYALVAAMTLTKNSSLAFSGNASLLPGEEHGSPNASEATLSNVGK